jgi:hypothetical protein
MGSPITGYKLEIKKSDGTYSEELTQCDARRDPIPTALTCMVTKSALRTDPYNLQWGDDVWARVTAINLYGDSLVSEPGNGAKLLTYPDPPINLVEDWSPKTQTTIGIAWEDSAFDGGSAFTTYRVWYNQGHVVDTWVILASDLTTKTYSALNLSPAVTYKFKVEVRNIWDYSGYSLITGDNIDGYSNILEVLCAYKPTEPVAPVTSIVTIAAQEDCYPTTAESWNNEAIKICSEVKIEWVAPFNGGSPILGYRVLILQTDGAYSQELTNCDASQYSIFTSTTCTVQLETLYQAPWLLA